MAINYVVQANVVDLNNDAPRVSDRFWVDTNVWFWSAYPSATAGMDHRRLAQTETYTRFLQRCAATKASLEWCPLQFSELAHLIEKTEFDIARQWGAIPGDCKAKEYRHNHAVERKRITGLIQSALDAMKALGKCMEPAQVMDEGAADEAARQITQLPLDGHDLFFLQALKCAGITQVLSDDGDFSAVPGITLFTTNGSVIGAARRQGKLVSR